VPYNAACMSPSDRIGAAGWRLVLLASLGGTLEFYDFVIFGIFARDISDAVFPAADPLAALMATFAAFAAGYLARPIGGIVLAHYGDRYGRRTVFIWSVFVMSAATLGMGLVPTYAQIGVAASVLMVLLRLVQGFCLGGELPGALTYVVETAPRQAPLVSGVVFACVTMGVAVATMVSLSVRTFLDPALVPYYGWRIAFVLGGLGGVLSFWLRRSLEESPEFERMKSLASRRPFSEMLRTHPRQFLVGSALLAGTGCFNGLFFSHLPAYLSTVLGVDPRQCGVLADDRGAGLGNRHPGDRLAGVAHSAPLPAQDWRGVADGPGAAFLHRTGGRDGQPDAHLHRGGPQRRVDQWLFRGAPDRPVPDPHPLHRRGAHLQREFHPVQRDGAAGGDDVDQGNRKCGVAGLPDVRERAAGVDRKSLGGPLRRERDAQSGRR
jgi:MFS family permease